MKRCLSCDAARPASDNTCPACGSAPTTLNGFPSYAPALGREGGGFKEEYFGNLADLESGNFWFRSRNRLIVWGLKKYCPQLQSFLEIGCGTGYVLSGISSSFPSAALSGSEVFVAGLAFAARRNSTVEFMQMDARNIPFVDEFDAIGAFDVLEHIEEDRRVLGQIRNALKPGGMMLLTVPQHRWLWSRVDEYSCHVRRYTATELRGKVQDAGFEVVRSVSFTSSLLPAMMISRLIQGLSSKENLDPSAELRIPGLLNSLFEWLMCAEIGLIQRGVNFPAGGSRLVVARKV